jgi:NAD(P)H dehydrogenase (quinone)
MSQNERILVTGASGNLAQLTLAALLKAGQNNLIATTRDPEKVNALGNDGVDVRSADFKTPSGLAGAFKGATRLLLISTTDVGASRVEAHKNAVTAAKAAGVKHIIYTSCPNSETSTAIMAPDHAATEKFIKESGLKYTFLRMNCYAQFLMLALPAAIESGTLFGCAGAGKIAYVTREDCARAAAGVLINASQFENTSLDVSGPEAYSYADVASLVSEIKQTKVVYQDLSPEDYIVARVKTGLPELYAKWFASFELSVRRGDSATVTDAVKKLSGKPPAGLPEFLKANLN